VRIERGQRLVEDARAVLVLGAVREVRVEEGRRLPPEDADRAPAAALRRREALRLRLGDAGRGEHLGGERRGEPRPDHHPGEVPAAEGAVLHAIDPVPQLTLVHGGSPPESRGAEGIRARRRGPRAGVARGKGPKIVARSYARGRRGVKAAAHPPQPITTSTSPALTACPGRTATSVTVPAAVARNSFSIFIASRTTRPAPGSTDCPGSTSTATTLPGIGATSRCPAPAAAVPSP